MSETQIEEQEEYKGVILYGKYLYTFIGVCLFVLSTVSYNAYTANKEARKVNTQLIQEKESQGAKIGALISKRDDNRKQWSEEQEKIRTSMVKQNKLNESTDRIEAVLEELNISLIK